MEKVEFKNANGAEIVIGDSDPHILSDISGTGGADAKIHTAPAYQRNGSSYLGTTLKDRKIKLEIEVTGDSRKEVKERVREVMSIFNSSLGEGQLMYTNDVGTWRIYGTVYDGPVVKRKDGYPYHGYVDVGIFCDDPDWLAPEDTQIKMEDYTGGLEYPLEYPISYADRGTGGRVMYTGDNPAPVLLDFRVAEGGLAVVDPRIENENGEFIQIKGTIEPGQRLMINTNKKKLSVTLIDVDGSESDAWDYLRGTKNTYLKLHAGENVFGFSATSGNPELYLTFAERYSGVAK